MAGQDAEFTLGARDDHKLGVAFVQALFCRDDIDLQHRHGVSSVSRTGSQGSTMCARRPARKALLLSARRVDMRMAIAPGAQAAVADRKVSRCEPSQTLPKLCARPPDRHIRETQACWAIY
ncbi:hypothetical protein PSUB009319_28410 [Ralstonia sp. SET104]|nr:hypothetical protein PSUB009319_28410 [Ralstonia sp. SET104]